MTKLLEPKKGTGSKYGELFNSPALGRVVSAVHRTAIRGGYELEDVIEEMLPSTTNAGIRVGITDKYTGKKLIADVVCLDGQPIAVELKNGREFDTKKSAAEWTKIQEFAEVYSQQLGKKIEPRMCAFPCETRDQVVKGFKNVLEPGYALTGKELCSRLGIDHDELRKGLNTAPETNLVRLVELLLEVDAFRDALFSKIELSADPKAKRKPRDSEPRSTLPSKVDALREKNDLGTRQVALTSPNSKGRNGK